MPAGYAETHIRPQKKRLLYQSKENGLIPPFK